MSRSHIFLRGVPSRNRWRQCLFRQKGDSEISFKRPVVSATNAKILTLVNGQLFELNPDAVESVLFAAVCTNILPHPWVRPDLNESISELRGFEPTPRWK